MDEDERDELANGAVHGNGHQPAFDGARALDDAAPGDEEDASGTSAGGWVSAGGVLRWEPAEADVAPQAEADSPLAAEHFEMPPGAPDAPRVAAVRAWLLRKRAVAGDDLGVLLLRQREARADEPPARRPRRGPPPPAEAELALAEQQAAIEAYERLAATLDETLAHSGPARALVEYYLWLADQLDALLAESRELLAADPALPADPLAVAGWNGRAQAVVATRGRVERMMAPAPEE
ncbi:MAG TPA: hypothetical protein VGR57_07245 [Ktedonobacterales bacterium]|nr:hypothetical protein [Ktedonobacterales bacterium]